MKLKAKVKGDIWQYVILAICASFLAIFLWFMPVQDSFLKDLEFYLRDVWVRFNASVHPTDVVLVAVDEHSIDEQGPWPWNRDKYAALIDYVSRDGSMVIGLDLLLDIPKDSDKYLALALAKTKSVLAVYTPDTQGSKTTGYGIMVEDIERPAPLLAASAKGLGHVSLVYDSDGVIRRIPSFISDGNSTFPAMSLVIAALWQGLEQDDIVVSHGKVKVGEIEIPTSNDGLFFIGYIGGPGSFPKISATDVLTGRVPAGVFRDKVVLIGVTAPGLVDQWTTPFVAQGGMSGLEVIANSTQAVLDGAVPSDAHWPEVVGMVMLAAFMGGLVGQRLSIRWAAFFLVFGPIVLTACGAFVFFLINRFVVITPACLSWSFVIAGVIIFKALKFQTKEQIQACRLKKMAQVSSSASIRDLCSMFRELIGAKGVIGIFKQVGEGFYIKSSGQIPDKSIEEISDAIKVYGDLKAFKANWLVHERHRWHCIELASDSSLLGLFLIPTKDQPDFGLEEKELARSFSVHAAVLIERRLLLEKLNENCEGTLEIIMSTLEKKAPGLIWHSKQVAQVARKLAQSMGLDDDQLELIYRAGMLHDLGLVGVPDYLLSKKGTLTPEERVWLESHPAIGSEMVKQVPQLKECASIIRHHHERYDGKGYPDGLAGDEISIEARVLAVAEAFVSMMGRRYEDSVKEPEVILKEVMMELVRCSGTQFDATVVQALLDIQGDIICKEKR